MLPFWVDMVSGCMMTTESIIMRMSKLNIQLKRKFSLVNSSFWILLEMLSSDRVGLVVATCTFAGYGDIGSSLLVRVDAMEV